MEERHEGPIVGQNNGLTVIDCKACGFYHQDPLPTDEDMARMYEVGDEYFTKHRADFLSGVHRDRGWWAEVYARWLADAEECIPRGRLLDIGCGPGWFLTAAKARGWAALGVEPSQVAFDHAVSLGHDVVRGTLSSAHAELKARGPFDLVSMFGILEHVRTPAPALHQALDLLAPGGRLIIGLPRDFSPLQIATGKPPWWIHISHVAYFPGRTFHAFLEREGLEIERETTSWPMEFFLLQGDDYIARPELGLACHSRRIKLELELGLDRTRELYRDFAKAGIGRDIIVVAKRRGEA